MRIRALRYTVTFIVPVLALTGFLMNGIWTWSVPILSFGIIPLVELLLRQYDHNLTDPEERAAVEDRFYDLLLYFIVPVQWALLLLFFVQVSLGIHLQ